MMDQKPIDRFNLKVLSNIPTEPLEGSFIPMKDIPETPDSPLLDTLEPLHSGKIVKAPDRFMFLREAISDKYNLDPSSYNEAISDKDSKN